MVGRSTLLRTLALAAPVIVVVVAIVMFRRAPDEIEDPPRVAPAPRTEPGPRRAERPEPERSVRVRQAERPEPPPEPSPDEEPAEVEPADAAPPDDSEDLLLAVLPPGLLDLYLELREVATEDLEAKLSTIDPARPLDGLSSLLDQTLPPPPTPEESAEGGSESSDDGSVEVGEGVTLQYQRERTEEGSRALTVGFQVKGRERMTVTFSYSAAGEESERNLQAKVRGPDGRTGGLYSYRTDGNETRVQCGNSEKSAHAEQAIPTFDPAFDEVLRRLE